MEKSNNPNSLIQTQKIYNNVSPNDIVYFDWEGKWPKPVLCIKSFPRSGSTYIYTNFNANNFIVIKKDYSSPHNKNQPKPISVLRNFKDCLSSNIIMSNLGTISESNVDDHISAHLKNYTYFVDSFTADIDNRIPYLFSQLENDKKLFLESIFNTVDIWHDRPLTMNTEQYTRTDQKFIFQDISSSKQEVKSYRTGENYRYIPTSKTDVNYKMVFEKFDTLDIFNEINEKYSLLEAKILEKQSALGIAI